MTKPTVDRERYLKTFEHEIDWPSGTLEDITFFMNELKLKYPSDVELEIYHEWLSYADCSYFVKGGVYETPLEYESRIHNEEFELEAWEYRTEQKLAEKLKQDLESKLKKQAEQLEAYKALQKDLQAQGLL